MKAICGEPGPYGVICTRSTPHRLHRGWIVEYMEPVRWESDSPGQPGPDIPANIVLGGEGD